MTDPKPLTVTPAERTIEQIEQRADALFAIGASDVRLGFDDLHELITQARLALTLQRRVEELEAEAEERRQLAIERSLRR